MTFFAAHDLGELVVQALTLGVPQQPGRVEEPQLDAVVQDGATVVTS